MKSSKRRRVDVNLDELDRVLDGARQAPLSEADCDKLKGALHALAAMLVRPSRHTEKTSAVLSEPENPGAGDGAPPDTKISAQPGHGRNGAEAFGGARTVDITHQKLTHGDRCPECGKGNVYGQKEPKVLVRIVGQAPLAATVYSLERLRCGACGQVFTAQEPEGVCPEKWRFRLFSGGRSKIETAAVKVDGMNEILLVAESSRRVLHPLDFGVDRFATGVGDPVPQVRDDVFESPLQHPCCFNHRLEPAPYRPSMPPAEMLPRRSFINVVV